MKNMDLFCATPKATAICSSTDHRSMVAGHGGERPTTPSANQNYHHRHHHRHKTKTPVIPCSSQIPISPKSYFEKYRKSPSSSSSTTPKLRNLDQFLRRKSSADIADLPGSLAPARNGSSSSSSRYLLSETPLLLDLLSDDDQHYSKNIINNNNNIVTSKKHHFNDYPVFRSSSLSNYSYDSPVFQSSSSRSSCSSPSMVAKSKVDNLLQKYAQQKSSSLSRLNHHHQQQHQHAQKSRPHDDHRDSFQIVQKSFSHPTKPSSKDESLHDFEKSGRTRHQV